MDPHNKLCRRVNIKKKLLSMASVANKDNLELNGSVNHQNGLVEQLLLRKYLTQVFFLCNDNDTFTTEQCKSMYYCNTRLYAKIFLYKEIPASLLCYIS